MSIKATAERQSTSCGKIKITNSSDLPPSAQIKFQSFTLTDKTTGEVQQKQVPVTDDFAEFTGIAVTSVLFQISITLGGVGFTPGTYNGDVQYPCISGVTSFPLEIPLY